MLLTLKKMLVLNRLLFLLLDFALESDSYYQDHNNTIFIRYTHFLNRLFN